MTKVLLTNCEAVPHGYSSFFMLEKRAPIGLGFLAASLDQAGVEVDFIDNYTQPKDMRSYIQETKPDWVGISFPSLLYQNFLKLLKEIEDLKKEQKFKIIVGGPHPSLMYWTIPDRVDYVVIGEGEQAIVDIVKGKVKDRVVRYPPIKDLDTLPSPKWDIFEGIPYWDHMDFLKSPVFNINSSRGCPFNCQFCSVGSLWGKTYRTMSAKRIMKEIKILQDKFSCNSIYFREDNFTLDKKRVEEFCKLNKNGVEWVAESRISNLDKDMLEMMASSGCKALYVGLESGSNRMLKFYKKGITVEMIMEKTRLIQDAGIEIIASWIFGAPTETEDERIATMMVAQEIGAKVNNWNVFAGLPLSALYVYLLQHPETYYKIDENFVIYPNGYDQLAQRFYGFVPEVKEISDEQRKMIDLNLVPENVKKWLLTISKVNNI